MSRPALSRVARTALLTGLLGAGGLVGAPAARAQEAKPFAKYSASAEKLRDSLVTLARAQVGKKYVRGGTTPERGFDCSGLVQYVLGLLDVDLPRTARQQAKAGDAVAKNTDDLKPGDLLTFGKSPEGASHVGIYVGDHKYIHASVTAGRVIETTLDRTQSPLVKAWRGVRRLVGSTDDSSTVKSGGGD